MGEIKLASVSSLKKGSYVCVEGIASVVSDMSVSRPGKHGHAKVNMMAVGMLDGRKRNMVLPGHDMVEVPVIGKKNAQVLSIVGDHANVMDSETFETFDLLIADDLKDALGDGMTVVYWQILDDRVMKTIKSEQ